MIGEIDGVKIIATPEQYKKCKKSLEEQLEKKDKEIERLKRRLEEYQEYVEINHKEIERLNNIINKAIDFLKENACIDEDVDYFCDDLRYDECKTLLEILRGSDK